VHHTPAWYVLAWDLDKDASRLFRLDRIASPAAGEALLRQHALADAMPEVDPAEDRWERRPLG
jgi:predicted DNA-binding transcriptional regulator YafY